MSQDLDELILCCECGSLDHLVFFTVDEEDKRAYIRVGWEQTYFWRRLQIAWKYLFGIPCRYHVASEVIVKPSDYPKLQAWFDRAEKLLCK